MFDTAAEAPPAYGCPTSRDSCGKACVDPITNVMDHSNHSSTNTFAAGRISRTRASWTTYRAS